MGMGIGMGHCLLGAAPGAPEPQPQSSRRLTVQSTSQTERRFLSVKHKRVATHDVF